jgi:hypothetical protein
MIAGAAAVTISAAAVMRAAMAWVDTSIRTHGENVAGREVDIAVKLAVGDFGHLRRESLTL